MAHDRISKPSSGTSKATTISTMAALSEHERQAIMWMLLVAVFACASSASAEVATYIVHMDSSAMPRAFSGPDGWYAATLAAAADTVVPAFVESSRLVYVYSNALQGFTARLSPTELERVKKSPGFLSCYRDVPVKMDTTHTSDFLQLNPDFGLWPASSYGEDVIIGVVDTGITPESASFRDAGFLPVPSRWKGACEEGTAFSSSSCNRKLIGARSFSKGLRANIPNLNISVNSPRDTDGHGTHTSSTAGGSYAVDASFFGYAPGTARGMAPRARLAMYKVLFDEGGYSSDVVAGIDKAIADGVDVISLSLGLDGIPLYKDPVAIATFAAMEKGIFVSTSAGNEGPEYGLLHNGTPWVLTVAASTVDREFAAYVELGDGTVVVGESLYPGRPTVLKELPLAFLGSCSNITLLKNTRHKVVVCESAFIGEASSNLDYAKVDAGLIISNDSYREFYVDFSSPRAIIRPEDGSTILDYIKRSSKPTAAMRFRATILGTKPAPAVTTYSSRGPSQSCPSVLKPDVAAPGELILASWAQNVSVAIVGNKPIYSPFNIISGTSMASPHASGVGALLRGAHPNWSPAAIRSALITTAAHLDNAGGSIKDLGRRNRPATPLAVGSGNIQPNRALEPGLVYDAGAQDYVKLMCAMNYTRKQIQAITRSGSVDCSGATLDLNYPSFIAYFGAANGTLAVRKFQRTVTNVGDDAAATYSASVVGMEGFAVRVVPEKLVFHDKYQKQSFTLVLEGSMGGKAEEVVHGSLTWSDDKGKYSVRSPIVATNIKVTSNSFP